MNQNDFAHEFKALMLSKGRTFDPQMARVYYEDLKEFSEHQIKTAFAKFRKSADDFPTVGKIIALIKVPIDIEAEAERAWLEAESSCGHSENKYIKKIVWQIGGPNAIGYADYDYELPRKKKQFIALYKDLIKTTENYIAVNQIENKQNKMLEHK